MYSDTQMSPQDSPRFRDTISRIVGMSDGAAAGELAAMPEDEALAVLRGISPPRARHILAELPAARCQSILASASPENRRQWAGNESYPEGSVGRLIL